VFVVVIVVIVVYMDVSVDSVEWVLLNRKNYSYIIVRVCKHNTMYEKVIDFIKTKILSAYIILKEWSARKLYKK
jgi:diacylglycerol kinase